MSYHLRQCFPVGGLSSFLRQRKLICSGSFRYMLLSSTEEEADVFLVVVSVIPKNHCFFGMAHLQMVAL